MQLENEHGVVRRGIRVQGVVQGVGFRPFVYNLALAHGLAGWVRNDSDGVTIEIEGEQASVVLFEKQLAAEPPPLARIDKLDARNLDPEGEQGFKILESSAGAEHTTLISPDVCVCEECLAEVRDPAARRYRYPFTNCTNCGPRFTITTDIPYDRPNTTMGGFEMCELCRREYEDPLDRRFHAQPIACPLCGPRLRLTDSGGWDQEGDALKEAARLLARGKILAIKGLGGFHLACDAMNEEAVAALRARKHREEKPFALMAADLEIVRRFCEAGEKDAALLTGRPRPIVLLRRCEQASAVRPAASVAPGNRHLGFMLPYTPLHFLLLDEFAGERPGAADLPPVLVMTSGNVSDEPIAYTDEAAFEDLEEIADSYLIHNRPIHVRCDDSVVRTFRGAETILRRSRGYAPQPVRLAFESARPVLAVGAELKHTFCLTKAERAFVSHHIGDLENWETMRSFQEGVEHFSRIFEITPEVVAYDLHPEYLSTKWALAQLDGSGEPLPGIDLSGAAGVGVQHHHAHIASCLADNGIEGPVIGLALDGTGWGEDRTIWGCEILVAGLFDFKRAGHLRTVPLAGGAAAIKEPWRMAAVYLREAYGDEGLPDSVRIMEFAERNSGRWGPVLKMAENGVNSLPTSSAGRLFDAVAAVANLKDRVHYEGQAAIELEQAADPAEHGAYECPVRTVESASAGAVAELAAGQDDGGEGLPSWPAGVSVVLDGVSLFRAACEDLSGGAGIARVSALFHNGLAQALVEACRLVREQTGLSQVALSGGTFQNRLLLEKVCRGLEENGFSVFRHRQVPANDGGISLGQAAVAAARLSKRRILGDSGEFF